MVLGPEHLDIRRPGIYLPESEVTDGGGKAGYANDEDKRGSIGATASA
jgi:hypothetical protein